MDLRALLERWTRFQKIVTGLLALSLVVQLLLAVALLRLRAEAEPLLSRSAELVELTEQGPYIRQAMVDALLIVAADELAELAQARIQYTFHVSETVPIVTDIAVNERFPVLVSLMIDETIPVRAEIPFQEQVTVPVNLEIDQTFSIATSVPFQDEILVPIDEVIYIDERFETRVLGQTIQIPIRGDIPVRLDVVVPIDTEFPVQAEVPVRFPISETLPIAIDWNVPVDLEIPVRFPVETQVIVPFSRTIPISVQAPVVLDVPIDIALADTPLGAYLLALGERLRGIAGEE